jgi:hypothetical protein
MLPAYNARCARKPISHPRILSLCSNPLNTRLLPATISAPDARGSARKLASPQSQKDVDG